MKPDKIKALLDKYYNGETTLEEESLLKEALKSMDELSDDLKADAELFAMMDAVASGTTDQEIDFEQNEGKVVALEPKPFGTPFSWISKIAAGFAFLAIGVLSGWLIGSKSSDNTQVAAIREDINEMKQLVALTQLRKESASERIMATYEFRKLDSASDEILDALIYTFNNDDNANVKNAAADALYKFGNQDKVRKAFINGLATQTDPVLQIKLIDMLVGLDEKRALPKLQEMMQEESQMKVVKQKAAQGIGKLL
jgi:hypothetical protein